MDEDIKIVEHLLEHLQLKIDDGVHKIQYNELLHDEKTIDCLNATENILSRLKTAERMNDVLAEQVNQQNDILYDFDSSISYLPCNTDVPMNKCLKNECIECIKEWARKKVEDEL